MYDVFDLTLVNKNTIDTLAGGYQDTGLEFSRSE